jgi:tetratricopeptide (TPR) repeat protein
MIDQVISHYTLGSAYLQKGRFREAITEYQKVRSDVRNSPFLGWIGYGFARSGKVSDANEALNQLLEFSKQGHDVSFHVALVYSGMGDKNEALKWLEKACDAREPSLTDLKMSPFLDNSTLSHGFKPSSGERA